MKLGVVMCVRVFLCFVVVLCLGVYVCVLMYVYVVIVGRVCGMSVRVLFVFVVRFCEFCGCVSVWELCVVFGDEGW